MSIIHPEQLTDLPQSPVLICSTYINDILPVCFQQGISEVQIQIVLPRTLECVPLSHFSTIGNKQYYYLPWLQLQQTLSPSLSSDIVFPDVYKPSFSS